MFTIWTFRPLSSSAIPSSTGRALTTSSSWCALALVACRPDPYNYLILFAPSRLTGSPHYLFFSFYLIGPLLHTRNSSSFFNIKFAIYLIRLFYFSTPYLHSVNILLADDSRSNPGVCTTVCPPSFLPREFTAPCGYVLVHLLWNFIIK